MKYKLLKQGVVVNTIVSDLPFVEKYCYENGLTFEEVQEATPYIVPPTPAEKREEAYNTLAIVAWDDEMLTVTQAAQLWQYYAAEGSEKAAQLQAAIAEAKVGIRAMYPDEEVSV